MMEGTVTTSIDRPPQEVFDYVRRHQLPRVAGRHRDRRVAGASHADPRTTMRYDRARRSLDRHATYIVATFVAGASR